MRIARHATHEDARHLLAERMFYQVDTAIPRRLECLDLTLFESLIYHAGWPLEQRP